MFPGFFDQIPETRVSKFCPELKTLFPALSDFATNTFCMLATSATSEREF